MELNEILEARGGDILDLMASELTSRGVTINTPTRPISIPFWEHELHGSYKGGNVLLFMNRLCWMKLLWGPVFNPTPNAIWMEGTRIESQGIGTLRFGAKSFQALVRKLQKAVRQVPQGFFLGQIAFEHRLAGEYRNRKTSVQQKPVYHTTMFDRLERAVQRGDTTFLDLFTYTITPEMAALIKNPDSPEGEAFLQSRT